MVAAAGIVAAACGSSGGAATPSPGASVEAALLAFSQCMRDQGITDMPDPKVDSEGNVQIQRPPGGHGSGAHDAFAAARDKCDTYLRGVTQGFSHGDVTKTQDQFLRLAQCMRARGVDVPDPDFSQGGHDPGAQFLDAINKSDPTVQEALQPCEQQVFGSSSVDLGHGGGH
ncbi:MAG TPA: hypothetical protein VII47_00160 [Actinomycetota bacterium]